MAKGHKKHQGFTLVELSIVLVIIGLIVGGILAGQELIRASENRAQTQQIAEINADVNAFRVKYGCLPGDCRNATSFFTAAAQPDKVTNGNGDGKIRGYEFDALTLNGRYATLPGSTTEWYNAFDHLAAAGLVKLGTYDETTNASNHPGIAYYQQKLPSGAPAASNDSSYGGGVTFGDELGVNRIRLGLCYYTPWGLSYPSFSCNPTPDRLYDLDCKLDDCSMTTGKGFLSNSAYLYNYLLGSDTRSVGTCIRTNTTSGVCAWSIQADF